MNNMQTFVLDDDSRVTAEYLDDKRLFKQIIEALQIAYCLQGLGSLGWKNHPAVKMWKDYEPYLTLVYIPAMMTEWISRGKSLGKNLDTFNKLKRYDVDKVVIPSWFSEIQESHKANLIRKKPERYKNYWPDTDITLENYWPTKKEVNDII